MNEKLDSASTYSLEDGADIAVIGGGPSGSFFSIFALKMANMIGKKFNLTIFEPKDFTKHGPEGCNRCGGVISEFLVQALAVEGINFPDSVVQRGINSYNLHTRHGNVYIATPSSERTIATVYRGFGPLGTVEQGKESFDNFLLKMAIEEGALVNHAKIDRVEYRNRKPALFANGNKILDADLVVGAFGVNTPTAKIFEDMGFGYKKPATITTAIAEIALDKNLITEHFGSSIHLFLLPTGNIKFAAMIPKNTHVTLCILGENISTNIVNDFLNDPVVGSVLPKTYQIKCRCLPKMNISAPSKPFTNRVVVCGDAGSTRLFKDGLGAAYLMGKSIAKTVVFEGVSNEHFRKYYLPVYKSIVVDNYYGRSLFMFTDIFRKKKLLCKGMLEVVQKEQRGHHKHKRLSSILWDMFTGNERYKNIFFNSISVELNMNLFREFINGLLKR